VNREGGPPFFTVTGMQRACRAFTDDAVSDAELEQILTTATRAPSAENRQPWVFVVIRDEAARAALGAIMRDLWERGRDHERDVLAPNVFADVDHGQRVGIASAPVLIVVGGDTTDSSSHALMASVFPAVQNLLLAAGALGLGSVLTTLATYRADDVRAIAGFPDHIAPVAVIPLGRPAHTLGPPRRAPIADKVFRERFGTPWTSG
jgi:nitroreductase